MTEVVSQRARQLAAMMYKTEWAREECVRGVRDDEARVQAVAKFEREVLEGAIETVLNCEIVCPLGPGLADGAAMARRQILEAITPSR